MAAQRYSVAPGLFLLTAIAAGLDLIPQIRWQRTLILSTRTIVAAALLASIALHLRVSGGKLDGTPWQTTITNARQTCAAGNPEASLTHQPTGWFFVLPCPQLPN